LIAFYFAELYYTLIVVAKLVNTGKLKITFYSEKYASEVKTGSVIDFNVSGSDKSLQSKKIYMLLKEK